MSSTPAPAAAPSKLVRVLAYAAIYFLWGASFLAIRVIVGTVPPLLAAGVRFYWIAPTISAGTQLAAFDPGAYDPAQQPPLVQPYLNNGTRVGKDPVTGALLPAVYIGTFSGSAGTPNQGMKVYSESILNTPPIQVAPRVGLAWDHRG